MPFQVYLECLPEDKAQWIPEVEKSRKKYTDIKKEHISNRHRDPELQDLALNNPLSQEEHVSHGSKHRYHMSITWVSHEYYVGITWVSHGYHMGITWISKGNTYPIAIGIQKI